MGTRFEDMTLYDRAWDRQGRLESIRTRWDDERDDVVELTRPDLYRKEDERGQFLGSSIMEGTAPWALRIMALGFQGSLVNQNMQWRESQMEDKRFKGVDEVNKWLQDVDEEMGSDYARSNYYDILPKYTLDGLSIGSPVMLSERDDDEIMVYIVPHYTENYLWRDQFGNDLGYHRKYKMTALQAMQKFGKDNLSQVTRTALENGNHWDEFTFLQVIYSSRDPILQGIKDERIPNSPWVQFYFQENTQGDEDKKALKADRWRTKPFAAWHYWREGFETYSRTPATFAIHDIKGGQQQWESMHIASEKTVRPAWWLDEAMRGILSFLPDAKNYADAQTYMRPPIPMHQGIKLAEGLQFAERTNKAIERWFMVPMFQAINRFAAEHKQPPTAFQVQQMIGENALLLGPGVGSYVNGLLKPQDDRLFELKAERDFDDFGNYREFGSIPQPPDIILNESDGKLQTEFIGPLTIAQKQFLVSRNVQDNLAQVAPLIEMNPDWIDKIKGPEIIEYILEQGNMPQQLITPQDEYELMQENKARKRAIQELLASGADLSKIVSELGDEIDKNSPLAALVAA